MLLTKYHNTYQKNNLTFWKANPPTITIKMAVESQRTHEERGHLRKQDIKVNERRSEIDTVPLTFLRRGLTCHGAFQKLYTRGAYHAHTNVG